MKRLTNFLSLIIFLSACDQIAQEEKGAHLPPARGEIGEIICVVDSAQQKGKVGNALKRTFRKPMRGLPQDEPLFDIKFVTPQKMNKVLRYAKNLIFVTILDDESQGGQMLLRNFTEESIEKIKNNPNLFMFIKQNDFAYGQEIVHLFGNNPKEMALLHHRTLLRGDGRQHHAKPSPPASAFC